MERNDNQHEFENDSSNNQQDSNENSSDMHHEMKESPSDNGNQTEQENTFHTQQEPTASHEQENKGVAESARANTQAKKPKIKKQKSGFSSLVSGLVGGVIAAVIVALLFVTNVIPTNTTNSSNTDSANANESATPPIAETVTSSNVNVASTIDEASKAVVGVLNMQQKNIWTKSMEAGSGSGIIYKEENGKAYVVTNHHVVEGAEEVKIVLNNGDRINAKVLGSDPLTDLAVLQVDGKKINTVADLGSSKNLKVGQTVIAVGNPLGMNFANSVTKGIISGLNRSVKVDVDGDGRPDWVTEVIQTDAAINPGNSGGALLNADGEVIGINSMKIARRNVEGIGFAIPIGQAKPIMKQLEENGKVARPYIGISTVGISQVPLQYRDQIQLPDSVKGGMVVAQVEPGSPAAEANLQQFDVITKINGHEIKSILDLRKYMYTETEIGETVEMEVYRNGEPQTVELTLAKRAQQN
ncbi:S1C family serine protease [Virgibacillus ihumii]|uniref:S1C family serine protease n=1 Tax=Virgibacillus ihumii TaxID=2686091 RepID=UPI001FEB5B26|nr:trypsin-like peptidase domain-containing protein [Virgibacillus ihumii]